MSAGSGPKPFIWNPRHFPALISVAALLLGLTIYRRLSAPIELPPAGAPGDLSSTVGMKFDPNTATLAELELLPGLGEIRAGRVIAWRDAAKAVNVDGIVFHDLAELKQVKGVPAIVWDGARDYLTFPPSAAVGAATTQP